MWKRERNRGRRKREKGVFKCHIVSSVSERGVLATGNEEIFQEEIFEEIFQEEGEKEKEEEREEEEEREKEKEEEEREGEKCDTIKKDS